MMYGFWFKWRSIEWLTDFLRSRTPEDPNDCSLANCSALKSDCIRCFCRIHPIWQCEQRRMKNGVSHGTKSAYASPPSMCAHRISFFFFWSLLMSSRVSTEHNLLLNAWLQNKIQKFHCSGIRRAHLFDKCPAKSAIIVIIIITSCDYYLSPRSDNLHRHHRADPSAIESNALCRKMTSSAVHFMRDKWTSSSSIVADRAVCFSTVCIHFACVILFETLFRQWPSIFFFFGWMNFSFERSGDKTTCNWNYVLKRRPLTTNILHY